MARTGMRWGLALIFAVLASTAGGAAWSASPRLALVMGNASYGEQDDWAPLPNVRNDVREMRKVLTELGFRVLPETERRSLDLDRTAMEDAVLAMKDALARGDGREVALVYFSGHGLKIGKGNFLIPVKARIEREEKASSLAYSAETILGEIGTAPGRLNLLLIDACRTDPFVKGRGPRWKGAEGEGFTAFGQRAGTVIGYATEPGTLASAGLAGQTLSPYTGALIPALRTPGLTLQKILSAAETKVADLTGGQQVPHMEARASLLDWVAIPAAAPPPSPPPPQQQVAVVAPPTVPAGGVRPAPVVGTFPWAASYTKGQVFRDCPDCPEMVVVPAGSFDMGLPENEPDQIGNEGPQHRVTINQAIAVGRYAVTFAEWDSCVAGGGCNDYRPGDNGWGRGRRPVINVSWADAQAYVSWLRRKTGQPYRLLSESEREYATRAGTTGPFSTGDRITPEQANFCGDSTYNGSAKGVFRKKTVEVGSFPANGFGLYDMHGNVLEWIEDCWHDDYKGAPSDGQAWTTGSCRYRGLRGGSWVIFPVFLRSATRSRDLPDSRSDTVGFRVARTLTP